MKLRHLCVEHFRGIQHLDWTLGGNFLCLVGPGDACKSTVLDAIELVLTPRWNPVFDDSDFFNGETTQPITISATLGELPRPFLSDAHFGLRLRGRSPSGHINDEPAEGDEEVITLRLSVDSSLEPHWHVVTDRHPEGLIVNARERERFGMVRLGGFVDRDLSWSRGSALSRLTGDVDEHASILAEAGRLARKSVDVAKLPKLNAASTIAEELGAAFGVCLRNPLEPRIDPGSSLVGSGGLALHDGPVPLRRFGLGTRRLMTLALQRYAARKGGVVLIDEIEHGLEPFRLRRLLTELLHPTKQTDESGSEEEDASASSAGVVVLTTHSAVVLGQLSIEHIRIVRTNAKDTTIQAPGADVQRFFRRNPEAFLSRNVIVCEGDTELGLLVGLDEEWSKLGKPFAANGVALADGGGCTNIGEVALVFQSLGYPTAILADSDRPLDKSTKELEAAGVLVHQWRDSVATEQRIFLDLSWEGVVDAINLAIGTLGSELIRCQLGSALGIGPNKISDNPSNWKGLESELKLRAALGQCALSKNNAWFKRVDLAAGLGRLVAMRIGEVPESDLSVKLNDIKLWASNA